MIRIGACSAEQHGRIDFRDRAGSEHRHRPRGLRAKQLERPGHARFARRRKAGERRAPGETRVALSPAAVAALVADGVEVAVQSGAGDASFIGDEAFREAGAKIVPDAAAVYGDADVVVRVGRPTDEETGMMRSGAILIGYAELRDAMRAG